MIKRQCCKKKVGTFPGGILEHTVLWPILSILELPSVLVRQQFAWKKVASVLLSNCSLLVRAQSYAKAFQQCIPRRGSVCTSIDMHVFQLLKTWTLL